MLIPKAMWKQMSPRFLPFADAASEDLPLGRLLRLSLFQVSVGMAMVLLSGTLNRVMIVELDVPAWIVAVMVGLPLVFAPFRALIGHRSDQHRSYLGWRRVPYILFGTGMQWGGFAIMPFALLVLSENASPVWLGEAAAALAFLMVGLGIHTTQTAGLALANDLATPETRPRVVALLYVMLLVGMAGAALVFGALLTDFKAVKLIQIVQGAAVVSLVLNAVAIWKQEKQNKAVTRHDRDRPSFAKQWNTFMAGGRSARLLIATGIGTAGFAMQDILLEPYGGEVLDLSVSQTTILTALMAIGSLAGFWIASRVLTRGADPHKVAAYGIMAGLGAFSAVIFADPLGSPDLFRTGTVMIGFGAGLFLVGTLIAAMDLADTGDGSVSGLALGAWGAVQATSAGIAVAAGGAIRDIVSGLAMSGAMGPALDMPSTGYGFVYHIEIGLLFATLVAIGPLVRRHRVVSDRDQGSAKFGLAELPT
ncbi:MAG: BCD family MFS transporter [Pseudomonadota bacterium]